MRGGVGGGGIRGGKSVTHVLNSGRPPNNLQSRQNSKCSHSRKPKFKSLPPGHVPKLIYKRRKLTVTFGRKGRPRQTIKETEATVLLIPPLPPPHPSLLLLRLLDVFPLIPTSWVMVTRHLTYGAPWLPCRKATDAELSGEQVEPARVQSWTRLEGTEGKGRGREGRGGEGDECSSSSKT